MLIIRLGGSIWWWQWQIRVCLTELMWSQAGSEVWLLSIIRSKLIIIASPHCSPHWTGLDSVIKICRYFCTKHKLSSMLGTRLAWCWNITVGLSLAKAGPACWLLLHSSILWAGGFHKAQKINSLSCLHSASQPASLSAQPGSEMLLMRSWRFQVKSALHPQFLAVWKLVGDIALKCL